MIIERRYAVQIKVDRAWQLHSAAQYTSEGDAEAVRTVALGEEDVQDARVITITTSAGPSELEDLLGKMIARTAETHQTHTDQYLHGTFDATVFAATIVHDEPWSDAEARITDAVHRIVANRG